VLGDPRTLGTKVRLGIEICCSVNSVLAQLHGISRPILASPSSAAYVAGQPSLMLADSLGSSVALVRERLRPRARGRAGNLKSMLRVVIERQRACALDDESLLALVSRIAVEDGAVYEHASPPNAACAVPLEPAAITAKIADYLDQTRALNQDALGQLIPGQRLRYQVVHAGQQTEPVISHRPVLRHHQYLVEELVDWVH
jgi:hypothetical protein